MLDIFSTLVIFLGNNKRFVIQKSQIPIWDAAFGHSVVGVNFSFCPFFILIFFINNKLVVSQHKFENAEDLVRWRFETIFPIFPIIIDFTMIKYFKSPISLRKHNLNFQMTARYARNLKKS